MYKEFLIFVLFLNLNNCLDLCGDWTQYKDTKCIKVIEKLGTEEEALKNCTQLDQSSGLLTIHSKEEQEFYNNLLKKYQNISLIAWIGMKYMDKAFKWIDGTAVEFENWSNDAVKDGGHLCVQMSLEKDVGKWTDESCKKKALIVCQKKQEISLNTLRIAFESKIESLEKEVKELRANSIEIIPIGFLYTQLPNQTTPSELWPSMKWTEVTKQYQGVFFRAEGGGSLPFGQIQQSNQSWISDVYFHGAKWSSWSGGTNDNERYTTLNRKQWTDVLQINGGTEAVFFLKFFTTEGEVRPTNTAIKIWKRIQ